MAANSILDDPGKNSIAQVPFTLRTKSSLLDKQLIFNNLCIGS